MRQPLAATKPHPLQANTIPANAIGFDFDGVIADTAEAFIRLACEEHQYCSFTREDITNFELENCIDMPRQIVEQIFTEILLDSVKTKLLPIDGAIKALSSLATGHTVTVITARPVHLPVIDWLHLYFDKEIITNFTIVATGDHNDKIRHIHEHKIRYFIDDRPATCEQLADASITPIVFTQPWNEKRHSFHSVANWDQILNLINLEQEI